jgi:lipoprotein-anchoring transpeptidase ErfK/SrfK
MLPRDASLNWDGENLTSTPGELGYAINIDESIETINQNPGLVLTSGYLRVPLKPLFPAVNDVSEAMEEAQRLVDTRLTLKAFDPITDEWYEWDVPRESIGSWLSFRSGAQGPEVAIEPERLAEYLGSLSSELGEGRYLDAERYAQPLLTSLAEGKPFLMTVSHTPMDYTVMPGETLISISWKVGVPYWMILNANPGIDPDALRDGQTITIPSKDDLLPFPVVPNKRILISISRQRMWVYQDGQQIAEHIISTGLDRSPTQPGIFQVQTHDPEAYASVWDLTMPNFLGIYEAWPGFMNGIHGLPMLSNGRRLWANILGKPASYGCIILDLDAAESLYNWAEDGVVVEIQA